MISISNSMKDEILVVLGDLRRMAWDKKGDRASNMRRRARLIEDYLSKKQTIKK